MKIMKASLSYLFIIISILSVSCSNKGDPQSSVFFLPWPDASGQIYKMPVNINSIDNIEEAKGRAAEIFVSPTINESSFDGVKPNLRFSIANGMYVPKDSLTEEILTLYAHFENLQKIDHNLGLDKSIKWPRIIGVDVRAKTGRSGLLHDNASYIALHDVTLFFPFQNTKKLALSLNPGVVAHEHFHAIFAAEITFALAKEYFEVFDHHDVEDVEDVKTFPKKELTKNKLINKEKYRKQKDSFLLRAYTEAFADLWAIMYSGNLSFLSDSLRISSRVNRNYQQEISAIQLKKLVPVFYGKNDQGKHESKAYRMASYIVRLVKSKMEKDLTPLFKTMQVNENGRRTLRAEYIKNILFNLKEVFLKQYKEEGLKSEAIVEALYQQKEEKLDLQDCKQIISYASKDHPLNQSCMDSYKEELEDLSVKIDFQNQFGVKNKKGERGGFFPPPILDQKKEEN